MCLRVARSNRLSEQFLRDTGETLTDPRWAVAWKFPALEASTRLEDVTFSVGRTGHVVPLAVLEQVEIGGVMVQRATLHYAGMLTRLDFRKGDLVVLQRAGDVIPQVVGIVDGLRGEEVHSISIPTHCPSCGSLLERRSSEIKSKVDDSLPFPDEGRNEEHDDSGDHVPMLLFCPNTSQCPAQSINRLEHFARVCFEGIGPGVVGKLEECKLVSDISDFYSLKLEDLRELDGLGDLSAANILNAVDDSKHISLDVALFGFGIPHVGQVAAKLLHEYGRDINRIREMDVEALLEIKVTTYSYAQHVC